MEFTNDPTLVAMSIAAVILLIVIIALLRKMPRQKISEDKTTTQWWEEKSRPEDKQEVLRTAYPSEDAAKKITKLKPKVKTKRFVESTSKQEETVVQNKEAKPSKDKKASKEVAEKDLSKDIEAIPQTFPEEEIGNIDDIDETISVNKTDCFSEYLIFKQFGYQDQAAEFLNKHLLALDDRPHDLLIELCSLYLECGDIHQFVIALKQYEKDFSPAELEALVKTAMEVESMNIELLDFAKQKLSWTEEQIQQILQGQQDFD
ncbi:MAG: hypothetical protein J6V99_08310 [Neisseriaceae bacterium]|nr:hypothetical protein [Neisseriaceae bacterium]